MLGPNLTTFLFKLLHQILPTGERVSRILPNQTPTCTRCRDSGPSIDTLQHAMFDCSESQEAGAVLLAGLRNLIPTLTPAQILTLEFNSTEDLKFSITWSSGQFLFSLWPLRAAKKSIQLIQIRSDMESNYRLLRESRLAETTAVLNLIF